MYVCMGALRCFSILPSEMQIQRINLNTSWHAFINIFTNVCMNVCMHICMVVVMYLCIYKCEESNHSHLMFLSVPAPHLCSYRAHSKHFGSRPRNLVVKLSTGKKLPRIHLRCNSSLLPHCSSLPCLTWFPLPCWPAFRMCAI